MIDERKLFEFLNFQINMYRKLQTPLDKFKLGEDVGSMRGAKNALKEVIKYVEDNLIVEEDTNE